MGFRARISHFQFFFNHSKLSKSALSEMQVLFMLWVLSVVWWFLCCTPQVVLPEERVRQQKHVGSKRKAYYTSWNLISSPFNSVCVHSFPHIIKPSTHHFILSSFPCFFSHKVSLHLALCFPHSSMLQLFALTVNFSPKIPQKRWWPKILTTSYLVILCTIYSKYTHLTST